MAFIAILGIFFFVPPILGQCAWLFVVTLVQIGKGNNARIQLKSGYNVRNTSYLKLEGTARYARQFSAKGFCLCPIFFWGGGGGGGPTNSLVMHFWGLLSNF